jgi:hydrogenase maturation protein HypF
VSCLAENRTDGPVIGLSLDGTGYGDDGTVWGGEVLVADAAGFERAGRLERVPMPGAAAAVREPWRMAVSCLLSAFGEDFPGRPLPWLAAQDPARVAAMAKLCRAGVNAPLTSSAGRLFDAVASLVGLKDRSAFEGQAAMLLEMAADPAPAGRYEAVWSEGPPLELAVGPIVRGVVSDLEKGVSIGVISRRFHDTLAAAFRDVCRRLRSERGLARVALSGGVFQNALLFGRLAADLASDGFEVLSHRLVPTNDGGIALGQAVAAAARLRREETQGPPPDTTP